MVFIGGNIESKVGKNLLLGNEYNEIEVEVNSWYNISIRKFVIIGYPYL